MPLGPPRLLDMTLHLRFARRSVGIAIPASTARCITAFAGRGPAASTANKNCPAASTADMRAAVPSARSAGTLVRGIPGSPHTIVGARWSSGASEKVRGSTPPPRLGRVLVSTIPCLPSRFRTTINRVRATPSISRTLLPDDRGSGSEPTWRSRSRRIAAPVCSASSANRTRAACAGPPPFGTGNDATAGQTSGSITTNLVPSGIDLDIALRSAPGSRSSTSQDRWVTCDRSAPAASRRVLYGVTQEAVNQQDNVAWRLRF